MAGEAEALTGAKLEEQVENGVQELIDIVDVGSEKLISALERLVRIGGVAATETAGALEDLIGRVQNFRAEVLEEGRGVVSDAAKVAGEIVPG